MITDRICRLRLRGSEGADFRVCFEKMLRLPSRLIRKAASGRRSIAWLCIVFCIAVISSGLSRAGTIHTKDGKDLQGDLHLEPDAITIHRADGDDTHFTLDEISHIDLAREPAAPVTDAPGLGGLKGEYFLGTSYDPGKRKLLRLDPTINFVWKYNRDAVFMPNEWTWVPFCVRWTGQIRPLHSENYTLRIRDPLPSEGGDIHGKLWIDRTLVIDDGGEAGEIHFEAGHLYDLKFESIATRSDHRGKPTLVRLTWESQSQRRQIVPATCLYVPPNTPDAPVVSRIISLPRDSMVYAPSDISIEAKVEPNQRALDRVNLMADTAVLNIFQTAPYQFDWKNAPLGDYQIGVTAFTKDSGKWSSGHARVIVADNDGGKIPKPWARFNIGDSSQEPVTFTDQKITLSRTGGELYAKLDKFQYVYQMLTGDGEIVAKLSDLTTDAPNAQPTAGLMIRRSLADNSRECGILFQPGVGTVFLNRGFEGEASLNAPSTTPATGYLKLLRDGQIVRAYRSEDGTNWQFVDQKELDLSATVLIGIALSAQTTARANAVFENVTITSNGLHNYTQNGTGVILTDASQINGDVVSIEKGIITLDRGDKKNRQHLTIDLKSTARINFHHTETGSPDQPDPAWRGVILSHGDLFEGDVKIRGYHDIKVTSDVFGPRTFNAQYNLASIVIASIQPRPAVYDLILADGSILHCDKVEIVRDGFNIDTVFAKGLHIEAKDLSQLTVPAMTK